MMDFSLPQTIGAVIAALISGGLLKTVYDVIVARNQQELATASQEFDQATLLINRLEKRINDLEAQAQADEMSLKLWAKQVEQDRDACRKEHAEAMHKIGELHGRLEEVSKLVCPFPAAHQQQPAKDHGGDVNLHMHMPPDTKVVELKE